MPGPFAPETNLCRFDAGKLDKAFAILDVLGLVKLKPDIAEQPAPHIKRKQAQVMQVVPDSDWAVFTDQIDHKRIFTLSSLRK